MANSAPGKHYRKGISLTAVFKMFPDSATAEAWFAERRWGGTPACPHCGSLNVQSGCKHRTMPYRCREKLCSKRFSVKVGTVMESSNLDYQTWAIAMYLMVTNLKGISSMKLHRELDITQKSAWHLAHRLRKSLETTEDPFFGPVGVDEVYLGELRKNMSNAKRAHKGTFHKLSPKHLDRYVQEFTGRHNLRERDTLDIFKAVTRGMEESGSAIVSWWPDRGRDREAAQSVPPCGKSGRTGTGNIRTCH